MLNDSIRAILKTLFLWAGDCYKQWRKESFGKNDNKYICFSVDEPEVQKHFTALVDFFLRSDFDKSQLFLSALEGNGKQIRRHRKKSFLPEVLNTF